jgi:hypothetical protein
MTTQHHTALDDASCRALAKVVHAAVRTFREIHVSDTVRHKSHASRITRATWAIHFAFTFFDIHVAFLDIILVPSPFSLRRLGGFACFSCPAPAPLFVASPFGLQAGVCGAHL